MEVDTVKSPKRPSNLILLNVLKQAMKATGQTLPAQGGI